MNRKFHYTDQIENYLEGKMTGEEMKAFETLLQNDPALKSEFQLQQDIIGSIKAYRKAELKARLDNIQVGSYGSNLTGLKIAFAVALTTAVGLGIYFYTGEKTTEKDKVNITQQEETFLSPKEREEETTSNPEVETPSSAEPVKETPKEEAKNNSGYTKPEDEGTGATEEGSNKLNEEPAEVIRPDVVEAFENEEEVGVEITIPENTLAEETPKDEVTPVEVESKEDNKHTFHYKFYNSKLYLYGDFKNVPYELIELNTVSGKSVYLYYNGHFYYLEPNQMEISPLKQIKDDKLVEELDTLRLKK